MITSNSPGQSRRYSNLEPRGLEGRDVRLGEPDLRSAVDEVAGVDHSLDAPVLAARPELGDEHRQRRLAGEGVEDVADVGETLLEPDLCSKPH
jgi:hypothetical protein